MSYTVPTMTVGIQVDQVGPEAWIAYNGPTGIQATGTTMPEAINNLISAMRDKLLELDRLSDDELGGGKRREYKLLLKMFYVRPGELAPDVVTELREQAEKAQAEASFARGMLEAVTGETFPVEALWEDDF